MSFTVILAIEFCHHLHVGSKGGVVTRFAAQTLDRIANPRVETFSGSKWNTKRLISCSVDSPVESREYVGSYRVLTHIVLHIIEDKGNTEPTWYRVAAAVGEKHTLIDQAERPHAKLLFWCVASLFFPSDLRSDFMFPKPLSIQEHEWRLTQPCIAVQ